MMAVRRSVMSRIVYLPPMRPQPVPVRDAAPRPVPAGDVPLDVAIVTPRMSPPGWRVLPARMLESWPERW